MLYKITLSGDEGLKKGHVINELLRYNAKKIKMKDIASDNYLNYYKMGNLTFNIENNNKALIYYTPHINYHFLPKKEHLFLSLNQYHYIERTYTMVLYFFKKDEKLKISGISLDELEDALMVSLDTVYLSNSLIDKNKRLYLTFYMNLFYYTFKPYNTKNTQPVYFNSLRNQGTFYFIPIHNADININPSSPNIMKNIGVSNKGLIFKKKKTTTLFFFAIEYAIRNQEKVFQYIINNSLFNNLLYLDPFVNKKTGALIYPVFIESDNKEPIMMHLPWAVPNL